MADQDTDRDLLDALKGYYDAFINIDDPKGFFYGLAEYLEFIDRVPVFEQFSKELYAKRTPYYDRCAALEEPALKRLEAIKKEFADYVAKHKIQNAVIDQALKEYEGWRTKKIVGSNGMLDGMHNVLRDVIDALYRVPEHKVFAERYIEFWKDNPELVKHYLPVKELNDYLEAETDYRNAMKNELWGQMGSISMQYQVIRHGNERHKKLAAEYEKTRATETSWELMNHNILNGEWQHILEDRRPERIYFFKVSEVRQAIARFQNQLVAELLLRKYINKPKESVLTSPTAMSDAPTPLKPRLVVTKGIGYLQLFDRDLKRRIAGAKTRQFLLVKVLFSPANKLDAGYSPNFQSHERVYEAIALPKDKRNNLLKEPATERTTKCDIIEYAIKEIQKNKKLRGYLSFDWNDGKVRMQITLPEGNENAD